MNANQEAPILRLPIELLQLILEYVPVFDRVRYQDESGQQYDLAQLLIIRQVCRLFRIVSHNLRAWYQDSFDFSVLLPYEEGNEQLQALREGKLLRALFDDNHFVVQLSKKRTWTFSTLESVFAVLHGVPLFPHNASQLFLELTEGLEISFKRLSVCRCLVDINVFLDGQMIDLDTFANSFPFLRSLSIFGLDDHVGSLNNLSALQSFEIFFMFPPILFDIYLIPVKSASTLRSLTINSIYSFEFAEFEVNPLDILHNLNDLSVEPLDDIFGEFLLNTTTRLTCLTIALSEEIPSLNLIRDVFSSRCLSRLTSFTFTVPKHLLSVNVEDEVQGFGTPVVDAITSNLSSLQSLKFVMGLHLGWCHYFSRLKVLKSLIWSTSKRNYNPCKEVVGEDLIAEDEDPISATESAFERVFADFTEKPVFSVEFT